MQPAEQGGSPGNGGALRGGRAGFGVILIGQRAGACPGRHIGRGFGNRVEQVVLPQRPHVRPRQGAAGFARNRAHLLQNLVARAIAGDIATGQHQYLVG